MEGKNRILYLTILPAIFLVGFCFSANFALAADDDLIITEIMYDPDGIDTGKEWVELYNSGESDIKIKSGSCLTNCWRFIDQFKDGLPYSSHRHTFSEDTTIKSKEFLIVASDKNVFKENYPEYTGNIIKSSFSLPNEESILALSSDGGASYFSKTDYEKNWGGSGNGKTLEKISALGGFASGGDSEKENWQESYILGGTPGEKSSEKQKYPTEISISELFPNPSTDEEKAEFIELYNFSDKDIDLANWVLSDRSETSPYRFPKMSIEAGEYLAIYRSDFKFALNNSGGEDVFLKDPNGDVVNKASYNETAKENYSYALSGKIYFWTSTPTPGAENIVTAPEEKKPTEENLSSAEKVYLNEILPNPKGDERLGEFIELANHESEPVDLYGFMIRDGSKAGKYVFKDHETINPGEYLAIFRPQFKIALNNSKESVLLYNPQGRMLSTVSYDKSTENASYNFDGKGWRWSKFLTPGKENKFDSPPKIILKKTKRAYKNLYTKFQVRARDKETKHLKYVWDFGDGHKSYLKNTSHKYLKTGKHIVRLTVRDASQTVEKVFSLVVQKYPRPKIEITKAVPNPKGLDSLGETVTLKNISEKKVNLLNYKIATGALKLVSHPIYSNLILDPGEEKIITRADSKIVLNNKAGKIALLYPDGKAADEIEYAKEKIADDEAYAKIDGQWQWIAANKPEENKNEDEKNILADQPNDATTEQSAILGATDEKVLSYANYQGGFIPEDAFIFLSQIGFIKSTSRNLNYCSASEPFSLFAYLLASVF